MSDISKFIAQIARRMDNIERGQSNIIRSGPVVAVDAARGLVKVNVGDEQSSLVTPWIKWTDRSGARKTWNPPSVGEDMTVISPSGEISRRSRALPGNFTASNAAPSADGDAVVSSLGDVTLKMSASNIELKIGGVTATLSAAGLSIEGGDVTHNGTAIGDTHVHGGISPGGAETSSPS